MLKYIHEKHPLATYHREGQARLPKTGYGCKIKTEIMVTIEKRKYRVYATCYSNVATLWIKREKQRLIFDSVYLQEKRA